MLPATTDFIVYPYGSITVLSPETEPARAWCEGRLPPDCGRMGGSFTIETNHLKPLIEGIITKGFTLAVAR